MADEADQGNEIAELYLQQALTHRPRETALPTTGFCHNCGDPAENAAFCCVECRDDWDKRKRLEGGMHNAGGGTGRPYRARPTPLDVPSGFSKRTVPLPFTKKQQADGRKHAARVRKLRGA